VFWIVAAPLRRRAGQLLGTPMALSGSLASGTQGLKFYFSGGYSF